MALTRSEVVRTATRILREYGLGDLTMRRLARELGVQPGALYWHVTDKQDLLVAVTEALLAALPAPPTGPATAQSTVRTGEELLAALLPVPDAADVVRVALAWRPEAVTALAAFEELAPAQVGADVVARRNWARGALDLVLGAASDHQELLRVAQARSEPDPLPGEARARVATALQRWARD